MASSVQIELTAAHHVGAATAFAHVATRGTQQSIRSGRCSSEMKGAYLGLNYVSTYQRARIRQRLEFF